MNVMKKTVFAGSLMMCASALATATYTYENDNKTYVATVTDDETDISQAAIDVLDADTVTNFVVCGTKRLHVDKGSSFTGDVNVNTSVRLSAPNSLGVGPGQIYVTTNKITMSGGTVDKAVTFNTLGLWGQQSGIGVWGPYTSVFKKKVSFDGGGLNIYPYVNSKLIFEGGLEGSGCIAFRELAGGTITFTNVPVKFTHNYPASAQNGYGTPDSTGFSRHIIFAVAENSMTRFSHPTYPFTFGELKTTVDYAFNNTGMYMCFGHDSKWDLCGTTQCVGQIQAEVKTGNPTVVTNSSPKTATLYMGMMYGPDSTVANIRFAGNLSVMFNKNIWNTIVDYPMTATGDLIILGNGGGGANSAVLNFTENGSWANATNVVVDGVGKIKIANPNALGKKTHLSLKSNSSLEISSGVTVTVRTLTVNGVQQPDGDYTFGSGTLHVTGVPGLIMCIK